MNADDVDSPVGGTVLRDLRIAAGMSQESVARKADCSTGYVRLLEQGFAPAKSDVLPRVMRVLSPPDEVRAAIGESTPSRAPAASRSNPVSSPSTASEAAAPRPADRNVGPRSTHAPSRSSTAASPRRTTPDEPTGRTVSPT